MLRLRPVHGMFFLVIALLAFGLGTWVARTSAPPKPPQCSKCLEEKSLRAAG